MYSSPAISTIGLFYPTLISVFVVWLARQLVRDAKTHIAARLDLWPSERFALEQKMFLIPSHNVLLLCMFAFYLIFASMLTVLPIPKDFAFFCERLNGRSLADLDLSLGWTPIQNQLARLGNEWTVWDLMQIARFWDLVLNVLLTIPLGGFIALLFKGKNAVSLCCGLGLVLFWELTQLTGMWWLAPCAWRNFSLSDLVTNTVGMLIGWLMGLILMLLVKPIR